MKQSFSVYLRAGVFIALASAGLCSTAIAQVATVDDAEQRQRLVDEILLVDYQLLFEQSQQLANSTKTFCAASTAADLTPIKDSYHDVMDVWQRLQWFTNGPADILFRHFRIQHWPDKHGTGARQIRKLLLEKDQSILQPAAFIQSSVATQGLSAMERLVFTEKAQVVDFFTNEQPNFRCLYLQVIATNMVGMAGNLVRDWQDFYRQAIIKPEQENSYFASSNDVLTELLGQMSTQLSKVIQLKLERPLGIKKQDLRFRHKQAESWRSARSLRNIKYNLSALEVVYLILFAPLIDDELQHNIATQWRTAINLLDAMPASFVHTVDKNADTKSNADLMRLLATVKDLNLLISQDLAQALQINLGFNGLDGD